MAESFDFEGVVEKRYVNEKKDGKGTKWVKFIIDGEAYSQFQGIDWSVEPKDSVKGKFIESNGFKNIIELKKVEGGASSEQPARNANFPAASEYLERSKEKDRMIVRQSCIKAAAELVGRKLAPQEAGKSLSQVAIEVAREFEAYVYEKSPSEEAK